MAYVVDPGDTSFTLTNYHYNNDTGWISFDIYLESIPYEFGTINGVQLYHGLFDEDYNPAVDPWSHWSGTELGWTAEHNPTSANFTINNNSGSSGTGLLGTMSLHDTYFVFDTSSPDAFFNAWSNNQGYGNNFYAYGTGIDGGSYETGLFWRADDILGTDPFDGDSGGNTSGGEGPSLDDFTHIGNGGNGSSQIGIDDNPYGYDDYTSQVEFYVEYDRSGGASLTVDPTTLYYDPGTSTYGSSGGQSMGVYFDAALGLASALVPSENTYTQVVHGVMHSSSGGGRSGTSLDAGQDGTLTDPYNDIPWSIELSNQTDIFFGRDASTDGSLKVETVKATLGDDFIDGGGGYNFADFSNLNGERGYSSGGNYSNSILGSGGMSAGVYVNLQSGYANFNSSFGDSSYGYDYYNQSWEGFQGFIGTVGDDTIYGTGMYSNTTYHDDANPLFTMNIADQDGISSDKGSNVIFGMGGRNEIFASGGNDFIILNANSAYASYGYSAGYTDGEGYWSDGGYDLSNVVMAGRGDDVIALGMDTDRVYGGNSSGGGHHYDESYGDSQGDEQGLELMSDDLYNDGPSFAMMFLGPDTHTAASTKFSIYDNNGLITDEITINFSGGAHDWMQWEYAANKQINQYLGFMDASGGVNEGMEAYRYIEIDYGYHDMMKSLNGSSGGGDPQALKLYFDEHLSAPNIDAYYASPQDYNSQNLASIYAPKVTLTNSGGQTEEWYAEMYAPTQSFVEGTGDDNDVYTTFDISGISRHAYDDLDMNQGLGAVDGDILADFDIGQNSLSLVDDKGESIYFESGLVNHLATKVVVASSGGEFGISSGGYGYAAQITLEGDRGGESATFYLTNLNAPTSSLVGENTYTLAAIWETDVQGSFSLAGQSSGGSYDRLSFEWQMVGENIGSSGSDMMTGTNNNDTFQGNEGNDVLFGAGGQDVYQFAGNFGNDKIIDFDSSAGSHHDSPYVSGGDTIMLSANENDVWFERMGHRGDELMVMVNDTQSSISIGRQYNPYTSMNAIEQIAFGFDGKVADETYTLASGTKHGEITVLSQREDFAMLSNYSDSKIYFNQHEGDATIQVRGIEMYDGFSIDFGINYQDGTMDSFMVNMSGGISFGGSMIELLSQNNIDMSGLSNFNYGLSSGGMSAGIYSTLNNNQHEFRMSYNNDGEDFDMLLFALSETDNIA